MELLDLRRYHPVEICKLHELVHSVLQRSVLMKVCFTTVA